MSAQIKPSPNSDETCSSLDRNPLLRLSSIPFGNAFSLFKHFDIIAIDVWGHSLSQTEGTIKFFHWAWANPLKVKQSVSTVQLVAHYLHDQHTTNDMYEDEYDIKDAIVMCNYVLHNKDELKNKSLLATVYKVKITALNKQGSYEKAVEAVEEAAFGHKVGSWDVVEHLVSDLTKNGLDELVAAVHFYARNKRKYDEFAKEKAREEVLECSVCMDASIQLVFSCGHAVTCKSCYDKMNEKKCPNCREYIKEANPFIMG